MTYLLTYNTVALLQDDSTALGEHIIKTNKNIF